MKSKNNNNSKYIFLDEIIIKLKEFKHSGKIIPDDKKLRELFENYPLDYIRLYNSLI